MSIGSVTGSSPINLNSIMQQKVKPDPQELIKENDSDSNGTLNVDEFVAMKTKGSEELKKTEDEAKEEFASLDTDGDGEISAAELEAGREAMMKEMDEKYGSLETMLQVNNVLNQTQQTLIDLMSSSNNADNEEEDNAFDFLTSEYSDKISEYLTQSEITKNGDYSVEALQALINSGGSVSELI